MSDDDEEFLSRKPKKNFFDEEKPLPVKPEARVATVSTYVSPLPASTVVRPAINSNDSMRSSVTNSSSGSAALARLSITPSDAVSRDGLPSEMSKASFSRDNVSSSSLTGRNSPAVGVPLDSPKSNRTVTNMAQSHAALNAQRRQSITSYPHPTNPVDAIKQLLAAGDGENRRDNHIVSLEHFRSLSSKKKLLSAALAVHDGNLILTVLRFLRATLEYDLFVSMLQAEPDAARQYLIYLKQCKFTAEMERFCKQLETVDSSILEKETIDGATKIAVEIKQRSVLDRFHKVCLTESTEKRREAFSRFSKEESGNSSLLADYARKSAILIELQMKLDLIEAAEARNSSFIYSEFPLTGPIAGKPLGETLSHCIVYHLTTDPNVCSNCEKKEPPVHMNAACFKKTFNVSEKLFQIAVTRGLTQSRRYELIDKILAPKGIASLFSSGSKKVKPAVCAERVVDVIMYVMKKHGRLGISIPANIAAYIQHIEDPDVMDSIAREYQIFAPAIEVYYQRKDKQRLQALFSSIPPSHIDYDRAKTKLTDPSIKWKT